MLVQDLNDMLYFAEVVERGSFAEASRVLGIPKSRLSRRVAQLENTLGVRLLHRSTRKLSLTAAGELYLPHCLALREEATAAAQAVAQVQSEPRGVIRVVCPVSLAQSGVGSMLPDYLRQFPEVQVEMQVSNRVVDIVEEGVDVALRVRLSLDDSHNLVMKHLGYAGSLLVASPQWLREHGAPQEPTQLARFPTLAMSSQGRKSSWHLLGPHDARVTVTHTPRLVADDLHTLKLAIVGGLGVGVLPDEMCQHELHDGSLVRVLPAWAPPPGIVHAVFSSRRGLTPAVRSFLDYLGERLKTPAKPVSQ